MQVKHTKVSPKLAFYCLETTNISPVAASKFVDPPTVVARGHKANDFALSFNQTIVEALV